ncbi:hypothetical protein [Bradyrhizobium erythrophlei]|uniref:hypothetical protein n=1 Tax=Bradyrhizobium erythrophlei TaxID=1437360 RepID=UPI001560545E|nr:hypothetical protein [Bradyrhizobium erythrophlei]
MGNHSQQVKGARILRIIVTGKPVQPFGLGQAAGTMMSHRGCKLLLGMAPGIHGGISKTTAAV